MNKKILMILVVIIFIVILFIGPKIYLGALRGYYPNNYSEYVDKYAKEYDIEKEWIYALIKAESNYKTEIVSQSGAVGLMQLMESTAEEVSKQIRKRGNGFERC